VQQAEQPMPRLPLPLSPSPAPPRPQVAAPSQAPPQIASIPSPPPAATISPDYRTLLSGWLESHKRYPEDARQRGEEGRAVLRFRVDRYGRVLDYAVVSSTGFADLDRSVEAMMRGATMPAFPPSMTMPEIEVSVTIRFGLSR
jgi:protein TonB